MRVGLRAVVCALSALVFLLACGGSGARTVETPTWGRAALALGSRDADLAGAIDLEAMRADPLFGRVLERFAKNDDLAVLMRASQIDLVANANARGDAAGWLAVIHGVSGAPRDGDLGSGAPKVLLVPDGWVLGEGEPMERARALTPFPSSRIDLPSRALLVSTVRGRALLSRRHALLDRTTDGLEEATGAILGGSHLEVIARFRYIDSDHAKRAAALAKVLLAAFAQSDLAAKIAAALVKIDFDLSGDTVSVRYTVDDDLREALQILVEERK